ncbi:MFS transporter, partial [Turicibacter sanguinis]|nr:MFS transporter [Turicibacter sanguinis]
LEDKYSSKKVLIFTFGFIGLLYLFMLINHPIIIIFAFILINSLYDLVDPISSKIINNEIPSKMRATILSLINLITSLIMFIGSLLIGYLSSFINSLVLFSIIGLLTIILSTTTLTIFYKSKSSTEKVLGLNYD